MTPVLNQANAVRLGSQTPSAIRLGSTPVWPSLPSQPTFTQVASDDFNRANGTLAGSNGWLATSDGSAKIAANEASGVGASVASNYRTDSYTSDQYAQCAVGSVNNVTGDFVGLTLRHNPATNGEYAGLYFISGGSPTVAIYFRTAPGTYTLLATTTLGAVLAPGTLLSFYAIGNVLVLQVSGRSILSVTDSKLTGGVPGVTTFGTMTLDSWQAGNATMGGALGAALATDSFNRANGNASAGQAGWAPITASFSGVPCLDGVIVSNELNAADADHHAANRTETFSADQWAQLGVGSVPAVVATDAPFTGGLVRWNGTAGYLCCFFAENNAASYRIYLIQSGAGSALLAECFTNGPTGSVSPSNPTGTVYTAVVKGSRVSMRVNGTEVMWVNDTQLTAGKPGYQLFPQPTGTTADNFAAGNV